jgi:hypothetical protein
LVGLLSFGVYLATLAPGLTWAHDSGDGGELAAAAATLGIAHPPGYPTYLLLAHAFTRLPIGEVATRTNLFSACCAAMASAVLAAKAIKVTGWWAPGVGAGLALAFSPLFWSQATVTEVHTLNGLFVALVLALVPKGRSPGGETRSRALRAAAMGLLWGLSLGNHPTALLAFPWVALALWRLKGGRWAGVASIGLGLLVYLYLPLRAASAPPVNWGNPTTLSQLGWMVSGALYHPYLFALPAAYLPARLAAWASLVARQLGWVGVPLAALGGAVHWTQDRPLALATLTTVLLCSALGIGYDTSDSYLYLVPALIGLFLWGALGAGWLLDRIEATRAPAWAPIALATLICLLPLVGATVRLPSQDLSQDRRAETFQSALLGQAPAQAILVSQEDAHTFALWYGQSALGRRPDVTVVDTGLLGQAWYVAQVSEQLGDRVAPLLAEETAWQRVVRRLGRPLCTLAPPDTSLVCLYPEGIGDP